MSYEALLRFAPAYDTRHFDEDAPGPRPELVVSHDALKKAKRNVPTPVVVDHDPGRVVGHVNSVYVATDVDYGTRVRRWFFAACELSEKPDWLKRGCAASWSYCPLHTYKPYVARAADTTVLTSCLFKEVSLLTPSTAPAEPLARVMYVKPKSSPVAPAVIRRSLVARRIPPLNEIDELHRRMEWLGPDARMEVVLENMRRELGYERRW